MAEEAKDPGHDVPRAGQPRAASPCSACTPASRSSRSPRCPSHEHAGHVLDCAAARRTRTTRCWASSTQLGLSGGLQRALRALRRRARRDDPVHRHQRRPDRRSRACRGRWPSTASCRASSRACTRATARRGSRSRSSRSSPCCCSCRARPTSWATSTRSGRCCRSPPRTSRWWRCATRSPTASGPTACRGTCASAGRDDPAHGRARRASARSPPACRVLVLHDEARTVGVGLDGRRASRATSSTARSQGLDPRTRLPDRARPAPARLRGAGLQHRARADLRHRPQRPRAAPRGQAAGRRRDRLRALRPAGAAPAAAARRGMEDEEAQGRWAARERADRGRARPASR